MLRELEQTLELDVLAKLSEPSGNHITGNNHWENLLSFTSRKRNAVESMLFDIFGYNLTLSYHLKIKWLLLTLEKQLPV